MAPNLLLHWGLWGAAGGRLALAVMIVARSTERLLTLSSSAASAWFKSPFGVLLLAVYLYGAVERGGGEYSSTTVLCPW
jgi:hypothetical protein